MTQFADVRATRLKREGAEHKANPYETKYINVCNYASIRFYARDKLKRRGSKGGEKVVLTKTRFPTLTFHFIVQKMCF